MNVRMERVLQHPRGYMDRPLPPAESRWMLADRWVHRVIFLRPSDEQGWRRAWAWARGIYRATVTFRDWRVIPSDAETTDGT